MSHGEQNFECKHCSETFTSKNAQISHNQLVHLKSSFICKECGRDCKNYATYWYHVRNGHKIVLTGTEIKCDTCRKYYKNRAYFERHVCNGVPLKEKKHYVGPPRKRGRPKKGEQGELTEEFKTILANVKPKGHRGRPKKNLMVYQEFVIGDEMD